MEPFVTAVLSGTNDAEEATAAVGILRATAADRRVVPQQLGARVIEPRKHAAASAVS